MRLLILLLVASFVGALFVYGVPAFVTDGLAMLVVLFQHILTVALDFLHGFVDLLLRTVRELFGL